MVFYVEGFLKGPGYSFVTSPVRLLVVWAFLFKGDYFLALMV